MVFTRAEGVAVSRLGTTLRCTQTWWGSETTLLIPLEAWTTTRYLWGGPEPGERQRQAVCYFPESQGLAPNLWGLSQHPVVSISPLHKAMQLSEQHCHPSLEEFAEATMAVGRHLSWDCLVPKPHPPEVVQRGHPASFLGLNSGRAG